MGDYVVALTFTTEQVRKLNTEGFKLCFTSAVGADKTYNVIAYADTVASKVTIRWKEQYLIAATKTKFQNGVEFDSNTTPSDISFQQTYTLPSDWTDGNVSPNGKLDPGSYSFANNTDGEASAVIYKPINGQPAPFYVSQSPVFSKGTETLTPKLFVALWFQKNATTKTMISLSSSQISEFNFTGRSSLNAHWDGARFVPDN
ncbi:hypothetical protein NOR_08403 [Metarhizium rileyi]|uniref:Uncharacterized protein n=1 Tax=Metarhizium rileyi (strain RCEF 4871) TaxID=1649241 RepID=A0A166WB19_METRR|nr:hypothetical protein NOR_08403 [Metarhizium rileyi RCEF 4871]TWU73601.1 hypothetical protein ED733_000457 [Metarhizium rileyi]